MVLPPIDWRHPGGIGPSPRRVGAGAAVVSGRLPYPPWTAGIPILLFGVVLLALAPLRCRRGPVGPALIGTAVFVVASAAALPAFCRAAPAVVGRPAAPTTCTSAVGLSVSGPAPFRPAYWPAVAEGLAVGLLAGIEVRAGVRPPGRNRASGS